MHKHTLRVFMRTRRMFSESRQWVVMIGGRSVHTMMSLLYRQPAYNIMTSRYFCSLSYCCEKKKKKSSREYSQNIISFFFSLEFEGKNMTQIYIVCEIHTTSEIKTKGAFGSCAQSTRPCLWHNYCTYVYTYIQMHLEHQRDFKCIQNILNYQYI